MITVRLLLLCLVSSLFPAMAANSFNILLYHHVADNTPASTTISPKDFEAHLAFLKDNGYQVLSLEEALNNVINDHPLPDKSVAITFDDGFSSIYQNAFPLLKQYGYPFTVFVATDPIDHKFPQMMSWDMLREMKQAGAIIANHTTDHAYLVRTDDYSEQWLRKTLENIHHAQKRLTAELGDVPKWIAYPYGEYNDTLKKKMAEEGWIGFGQQSGGVAKFSDFTALPRFPAASSYANLKTLKTKLASLPLPVDYLGLPDTVTRTSKNNLTVNLNTRLKRQNELRCYFNSNAYSPKVQSSSFTVDIQQPFKAGRNRINCTVPHKSQPIYYWFSFQWLYWPLNVQTETTK
ncbi:polysaccharide deacetylase family protein [Gynuella sp.]|uniref:polysaccharide deacetylase family protein n=1 Tax=Gynuella sp. TaxID=2969146 RepID=UPI003D0B6DAF